MKSRAFLYNSIFWAGIYLLWVLVFRSYSVSITKTMTIEFCYLIFITADYYAISNFIIPQFLIKKKYVLFVSAILLTILLSALLRALVALQMNLHFFHTTSALCFGTLYINSLFNIFFWALLITMGKMIIDRMQTQQQLELLEKERIKNETGFLKAQINPHSLFNSLNTIYGHIDKRNQDARNILLQFSELLRYQLYDCSTEKISLQKEVEYIKNYIAFQQLRKDENLIVKVKIENIESGLEITPLLLVVLIENAFKFVSNSTEKENIIIIKLFAKNKILHSYFSNTTEQHQSSIIVNPGGIGIANLKRRLELCCANKYKLTSKKENDVYEANLIIDLA